jgi:hypothetical protein
MNTSNRVAHLDICERPIGTGLRREGRFQIDGTADLLDWHYDIYGGEAENLPSCEGFVLTALFYAMRHGTTLRVHGSLTQVGLYNLEEFVAAWAAWRPKLYKRFDIIPDKIITDERPPLHRAIAAFSGGVDGTFTVLDNKMRHSAGGFDIRSAMMVHGFDVDYDNDAGFAELVARVEPTLNDLGVGLKIIKTDSKKYCQGRAWDDCFGAQIAGCLHQFSGAYDTGLIGSSEPYTALLIPHGASPLTDRLFSGGYMSLVHHGAQFSRTMKVEVLARHPEIVERLKVCWEGTSQHENCGICEKCIRTRLNFMAVGIHRPGCFEDPFDLSMVKKIRGHKPVQLNELATLIEYATGRQTTAPWLGPLRRRLMWLRTKRALIDILDRFGLGGHARNIRGLWRRRLSWQLRGLALALLDAGILLRL